MIREKTAIGNHALIGNNTFIDRQEKIVYFGKIKSNYYIPTHVSVGNQVFLKPNVTLANGRYTLKMRNRYVPDGQILEDEVTLRAGVIDCPGVRIGWVAFVAAGAVVTNDLPPGTSVMGVPGRFGPLPKKFGGCNMVLS